MEWECTEIQCNDMLQDGATAQLHEGQCRTMHRGFNESRLLINGRPMLNVHLCVQMVITVLSESGQNCSHTSCSMKFGTLTSVIFLILRRLIDNYGQSFNKYIKSLTPISNQRKTKETQKPVKNDVLEMRIKRNEIKSNEMNI